MTTGEADLPTITVSPGPSDPRVCQHDTALAEWHGLDLADFPRVTAAERVDHTDVEIRTGQLACLGVLQLTGPICRLRCIGEGLTVLYQAHDKFMCQMRMRTPVTGTLRER